MPQQGTQLCSNRSGTPTANEASLMTRLALQRGKTAPHLDGEPDDVVVLASFLADDRRALIR